MCIHVIDMHTRCVWSFVDLCKLIQHHNSLIFFLHPKEGGMVVGILGGGTRTRANVGLGGVIAPVQGLSGLLLPR